MLKSSIQYKKSKNSSEERAYVVISYKDEHGKPKTKWAATGLKRGTSVRKLEAKQKEIVAAFEEELNRKKYAPIQTSGTVAHSAHISFVALMEEWLEMKKPNIEQTTYAGYAKNIRRIKAYFGDGITLDELTFRHIQKFYADLLKEGLSANSIKHLHASIHSALKYAVKCGFISSNPCDFVELPKVEQYEAKFYTREELFKLFEIFKGDRMELVVHIAAYYGLRRSEVVGLKWDAIDFENKTISVMRKVTNSYGDGTEEIIVSNKLKTKASRRTLPLVSHIEEMLLEEKKKQAYYKELLKGGYCNEYEGFVCRDNLGKLITPNFVTSHFNYMIKKHRLNELVFHGLRHSCASLLLDSGISMKEIQAWLGHSNFSTTANLYAHLKDDSKQAAAAAISNTLNQCKM